MLTDASIIVDLNAIAAEGLRHVRAPIRQSSGMVEMDEAGPATTPDRLQDVRFRRGKRRGGLVVNLKALRRSTTYDDLTTL